MKRLNKMIYNMHPLSNKSVRRVEIKQDNPNIFMYRNGVL